MATIRRAQGYMMYLMAFVISAIFSIFGKSSPTWAQDVMVNYNATVFRDSYLKTNSLWSALGTTVTTIKPSWPSQGMEIGKIAPSWPSQGMEIGTRNPNWPSQGMEIGKIAPSWPSQGMEIGTRTPNWPSQGMEIGKIAPSWPSQGMEIGTRTPNWPSQGMEIGKIAPSWPSQGMEIGTRTPSWPSQGMEIGKLRPGASLTTLNPNYLTRIQGIGTKIQSGEMITDEESVLYLSYQSSSTIAEQNKKIEELTSQVNALQTRLKNLEGGAPQEPQQ